MTQGSNFWVIGGEFGSMNFHKLVEGSAQVQGPFKTRKEAEDAWRVVSEENRHKAGVRFSIVEEPARLSASPRKKTSKDEWSHPGHPGGTVCVWSPSSPSPRSSRGEGIGGLRPPFLIEERGCEASAMVRGPLGTGTCGESPSPAAQGRGDLSPQAGRGETRTKNQ